MFNTKLFTLFILANIYHIKACEDRITNDRKFTVDTGGRTFKLSSCAELLERFPALCEKKSVSGEKGSCCITCKAVDPKCMDKLTKDFPHTVNDKKVTSCDDIVKDYKVLCKKLGKKKKNCCESCKGVDTKCVDELITFIVGKQRLKCPDYIGEDPCRCADRKTRKKCCESCMNMGVDIDECKCRDTLSETNSRKVIIKDKASGKDIVNIDVTDCAEIANYYAQFCKRNIYGGEGNVCCKSCTGIDPKCADLSLWKANAESNSQKCMGCTCHEIRDKSASLMKKVCQDDLKGIRSAFGAKRACCRQCERVGVMGQPIGG